MPVGNFGVIGTKHIEMRPNIDAAYLRGLQTASGLELTSLVRLTDQAMGILNGELDENLAPFISFTSEREVGRRRIGRKYIQKGGEYTTARPQRTSSSTYMLPIDKYDIETGFTEDGLHDISLPRFQDELNAVVEAWRSLYRGEILYAMFDPNPVSIARSSDVKSPRFVGSGTGDLAFTGTYPNGADIPAGTTHYFRFAEAGFAAGLASMVTALRKWHPAPYELLVSAAVADLITSPANRTANGFVPVAELGINVGLGTSTAALDADTYLGQLPGRVRVRVPIDALGTGMHMALVKSYGAFSPLNPLAWVYDEKWGRNAYVRSKDDFPLAESSVIQRFGIGVADRAGAAIAQVAATGAYTPPAITF